MLYRRWVRLRKSWPWLILAVGLGLASLAAVASFRTGSSSVPNPNGIDALVLAGSSIGGDWPNNGQFAGAAPTDLRAFLDRNRTPLADARAALTLESLVHFPDTEAGLAGQAAVHRRLLQVCRLLAAEHFACLAEGRIQEAWRSDLDALRVGQAGTQGGMFAHASMSWGLQGFALDRLRGLVDRLSAADCRAILAELDALDRLRVAPAALVARWERWSGGSIALPQRTMLWMNGMQAAERKNQEARAHAGSDKIARSFRFLMVQIAVHAYRLDRDAAPRSLGDLVPALLRRVPIDPTTGQPIDYPRSPGGELAEDLEMVEGAEPATAAPG